jgi:MFS family permease
MKSLWLMLTQRRYFSPAWVFASINIMVGTWILYLPYIKKLFVLNDAEVGSALFFTACGLLFSIPLVPKINKVFGVGRCTKIGIVLLSLIFNFPLIAPSYYILCGSLFLVGVFSGFTDISMNAVISIIEKNEKQNLMSAAHGFFSLGGFLGAGLGSFLIGQIAPPGIHMLLVTTVVLITNLALAHHYTKITEPIKAEPAKSSSRWKEILPVLGLSMISFIVLFNEGAVEHWSNLFLFEGGEITRKPIRFWFCHVFSYHDLRTFFRRWNKPKNRSHQDLDLWVYCSNGRLWFNYNRSGLLEYSRFWSFRTGALCSRPRNCSFSGAK